MKNIMFIAPPAAGKGTQAKIISELYEIPHISTGDVLNKMSKENNEMGIYIKDILASGGLVKDEILYEIVEKRLSEPDCKKGYIIDGFPRNIEQAKEYDNILKRLGYNIGKVILINIEKEKLENRVVGRRVCESCRAIFNLNDPAKKPIEENTCDYCGGKLFQRADDNLEAFRNRYEVYQEKTTPLIDFYKEKDLLYEVDGNQPLEKVFDQIKEIMDKEDNL